MADFFILKLKLTKPALTCSVNPEEFISDKTDPRYFRLRKTLFFSDEYEDICSYYAGVRAAVRRMTVQGIDWIRYPVITSKGRTEAINRLRKYQDELQPYVKKFLKTYEACRKRAKRSLKSHYNPSDYPTESDLRRSFNIHWNFYKIRLNTATQQQEADALSSSLKQVEGILAAELSELVKSLCDGLESGGDKTKKRFSRSKMKKLREFLESFPWRNIGESAALTKANSDLTKLLEGYSAGAIRNASMEEVKDLSKQLSSVSKKLLPLAEQAPTREIEFEE